MIVKGAYSVIMGYASQKRGSGGVRKKGLVI